MIIEDQAFSPSYNWAPHPPPFVSKSSLFISRHVCRRSSLLTGEGGGGRGWGRSQIVRLRERLALYKSINTL
jgi:hypothetical protein